MAWEKPRIRDWMIHMAHVNRAQSIDQIAEEALEIATFSSRYPGFDLAEAYDVAAQVRDMRSAHGENPIGRKIGFIPDSGDVRSRRMHVM
jgi:2-keto-4-pentenoate hydratase